MQDLQLSRCAREASARLPEATWASGGRGGRDPDAEPTEAQKVRGPWRPAKGEVPTVKRHVVTGTAGDKRVKPRDSVLGPDLRVSDRAFGEGTQGQPPPSQQAEARGKSWSWTFYPIPVRNGRFYYAYLGSAFAKFIAFIY